MLAGAGNLTAGEEHCTTADPKLRVLPAPKITHVGRLVVKFLGRRRHGIELELHASSGSLAGLEVELIRHHNVLARQHVAHVGRHAVEVLLPPRHHVAAGTYTLRITRAGRTLVRRTVPIGR